LELNQYTQENECLKTRISTLRGNELQHLSLEELEDLENILRDATLKIKQAHQHKVKDIRDETLCTVCFEQRKNIVFLDCKHFTCCEKCASDLQNCVLCRAKIIQKMKIF